MPCKKGAPGVGCCGPGTVCVTVLACGFNAIPGATVHLTGANGYDQTCTTGPPLAPPMGLPPPINCCLSFDQAGTFTLEVSAEGFETSTQTVTLHPGDNTLTVTLEVSPDYVCAGCCAPYSVPRVLTLTAGPFSATLTYGEFVPELGGIWTSPEQRVDCPAGPTYFKCFFDGCCVGALYSFASGGPYALCWVGGVFFGSEIGCDPVEPWFTIPPGSSQCTPPFLWHLPAFCASVWNCLDWLKCLTSPNCNPATGMPPFDAYSLDIFLM